MRYIYYYYTINRLNFVYHDEDKTIRTSYIGYSLRNAIKKFRTTNQLEHKRIKIIKMQ